MYLNARRSKWGGISFLFGNRQHIRGLLYIVHIDRNRVYRMALGKWYGNCGDNERGNWGDRNEFI